MILGKIEKNPFDFRRKWIVKTSENSQMSNENQREKVLEQKLLIMERKFQEFQEKQNQMIQEMSYQTQISKKIQYLWMNEKKL